MLDCVSKKFRRWWFKTSGDLSGSGSGSGGSYIDPRDRDLEAGDGYSGPDDMVRTDTSPAVLLEVGLRRSGCHCA